MCAVSVDDVRAVAEHDRQPAAGRRPGPAHARRVLRRRAHHRPAHALARGRPRPHRPPARAGRRRAPRRAQGRAGPGGRDRVVRSGLRRRATGRRRSSTSPAASTCSASPASTPSRARGRPWPPRRRAWWSPCPAATTPSARTPRPTRPRRRAARRVGAERVVAVDASAYFSRPGPRLVDGLELMAHILHPDLVPEPVGGGSRGRGLSARPASQRRAVAAGRGQRADDGDDRQHGAARGSRARAGAMRSAPSKATPDEDAADQAADVPADRDPADHEREHEVEQDQHADVGLERVDPARALLDRRRAHQPEDRARGADRQPVGRGDERAERAPQQRREVQGREARGAQRRLEQIAQQPQQVHVEEDVDRARVQEARGDQAPVVVAEVDGGPVEQPARSTSFPEPPLKPFVARKTTRRR